MEERRLRLCRRFQKQQDFAAESSPLSARICGIVARWLEEGTSDSLGQWLLETTAQRASFEVPLLLLAGLHKDVLAGHAAVRDLADYYPTVGGKASFQTGAFIDCLRQTIEARREALTDFMTTAQVQTNETARGLCWLLPVCIPGWSAIHLVDLGASAGLNLVAEQRHYQIIAASGVGNRHALGAGIAPQFVLQTTGEFGAVPVRLQPPALCSRQGADLAPFDLQTPEQEQTLAAFVWGDQVTRLAQLRQGIQALHRINQTDIPVRLHRSELPNGLPTLLAQLQIADDRPVVFYNTYLCTYLYDKGASLATHLATWAQKRCHPVLWLQWETLWQGPSPPVLGWVGWTADLWAADRHWHWHLAWTHPHGTRLHWLVGWRHWLDFWQGGRTGKNC